MSSTDQPSPPPTIRREDYRPPAFLVEQVDLHIALHPTATRVRARLALRRNPDAAGAAAALELDGEALRLLSAVLDGAPLPEDRLGHLPGGGLRIEGVPDAAVLETEVEISPEANSELSGLYLSGGNYVTQCEAEGFRRITYFPDRPDVMARYTTTLEADRAACPVLLSNGNPDGAGELPDGRHWARWVDPHPKPSYLFAVVAGDLVAVRDSFTTRSGREVALAIYVRRGDEDACGHAMDSLKRSMRWDEETYGLEYDLDVFNIAAVSDFNMGAMENKGLNVFNTKYILARPETATDMDYEGIETVVAHEYFHNWTGNRVTCRDWFQLSLKEGLTVFRDQHFSADQGSAAVKRLADVRRLRAAQFPEDAGPMAHPVRPDSYVEINNFYTATVYQKGAEVVRMMRALIGAENFRRGMDLYIARHDNQAVTIEDFVRAMQDASGTDLSRFSRWYAQAGTPELRVREAFADGRYTLTLAQSTPPTPGQPEKLPVPVPVAMGLIGPEGAEVAEPRLLLLEEAEQDFVFEGLAAKPVPSLLRGFSAPVKLSGLTLEQLGFLAAHDTDAFVRWESSQQYATATMLAMVEALRSQEPKAERAVHASGDAAFSGRTLELPEGLAAITGALLGRALEDPAFAAEALALPSEEFIADQMTIADPEAIHAVRQFLRGALGRRFAARFAALHETLADAGPYRTDGAAIGRRALRNAALAYLGAAGETGRAEAQFAGATNMTDSLAALRVLVDSDSPAREQALAAFHARWKEEPLVLDKWFTLQAMSPRTDAAAAEALSRHPDFDLRNPNRVRSLVGAFAAGNPAAFHAASGEGYRFLADMVIALDAVNTQVAARMVSPLGHWKRQDAARGARMRAELERIAARPGLSKGTYEKVSKSLAA
ncbi:aminopeptidase N [Pseudoroseomonas rhizosphaerae]|uniref:Aminopeptidase N n=1 Tax=Teichococcus rhizosphaerae TaxID=1335062 RepID=A0A2C7AAX8_9PROT|nr:aminopeptidase N [Pseudoroseomonas rhizosphaerae]PHK94793.1 aminopeptidase N [Pseudoroseomonas rhizosphaerae]